MAMHVWTLFIFVFCLRLEVESEAHTVGRAKFGPTGHLTDQRCLNSPTCDQGFCDQRGAIQPKCAGGGCKQQGALQPSCTPHIDHERKSVAPCDQHGSVQPLCFDGGGGAQFLLDLGHTIGASERRKLACDQSSTKSPVCHVGHCDQSFSRDCDSRQCSKSRNVGGAICDGGWCDQQEATARSGQSITCSHECLQFDNGEATVECSAGSCLDQAGLKDLQQEMVTCTLGGCYQMGLSSPKCDGGHCDQNNAESPTCDGGACDQSESKNPTCYGGDCDQSSSHGADCRGGHCDRQDARAAKHCSTCFFGESSAELNEVLCPGTSNVGNTTFIIVLVILIVFLVAIFWWSYGRHLMTQTAREPQGKGSDVGVELVGPSESSS